MGEISLFGPGFVGGKYAETFPVRVMPRDGLTSWTPDILYMISTTDNYHILNDDGFLDDIETNLVAFMERLKASHRLWGKDLVFNLVSTWFVYGQGMRVPAQEDDPCNPTGFYSITALAREQLLRSYCETFGLRWRILRLANVIGVGDRKISLKKNALQCMIKMLAHGETVPLYTTDTIRDFIDVRDCVRAIHLVINSGNTNEVFNISNGLGYHVREVVYMAQVLANSGEIKDVPASEFHSKVQTMVATLDNSKIFGLGYRRKYLLSETVRELVEYYKTHEE